MKTFFSVEQVFNWLLPCNSMVRGGVICLLVMTLSSCQDNSLPLPNTSGCGFDFASVSLMSYKERIFDELDTVRTMMEEGTIKGDEDFFLRYYADTLSAVKVKQIYEKEALRLKAVGLASYMDEKVTTGAVSAPLRTATLDLYDNFITFISSTTSPSLPAIIAFLDAKNVSIAQNTSLCVSEVNLLNFNVQGLKLLTEYYFEQELNISGGGASIIRENGCDNFWEKIKCGALLLAVGGVAGVAVIASGANSINVTQGGVTTTFENVDPLELALFWGILAAATIGSIAYEICCSSDDTNCGKITNLFSNVIGCNDFNFIVSGGGPDVVQYLWTGINTVVPFATTIAPHWNNQVVNLSQPADIFVIALCADGTVQSLDETFSLAGAATPPPSPLSWGYNLPNSVAVSTPINVSVVSATGQQYQLVWTCSEGGSITPTSSYSATATFFMTGSRTITATLTNTCDNSQSVISATTTVHY